MATDEQLARLGQNIRTRMRQRGMTQSELAERAGVTKAAMSAYVNGRRQMGVSALNGICDALGCTWHDLMKDVV